MPSSSKISMDLNPDKQTKEWIEKTVSSAFDELLKEITCISKLHPTEQHEGKNFQQEPSISKIYDLINSYHAFCKLCEQHFYSRSLPNDTNSFFQKHVNTSYHKQMRTLRLPPNGSPMFTWEEKYHLGRCNVCDMPGLNSYVLDTKFDPLELMKLHFCIWDQENRETNEKVLRKLNLLKKFCGLTVFREMYIKTLKGRKVCLLCGLYLPWSGEEARCHLVSDRHYQNFCLLLKKCFNFKPKDALNGFNLEMILRWLITFDPPGFKEFVDYDEREICFEDSNSDVNPYPNEKDNFSYSPKSIKELLKTEEFDFTYDKECLLCNVPFIPGHTSSERHQSKKMNLEIHEKSFDKSEKNLLYSIKREKWLHIIENYRNLNFGCEEICAILPSEIKVKNAKQTTASLIIFLKKLFVEKLKLVSAKFTVASKKEIYCHVCDQSFEEKKETHLSSLYHVSQEVKWEQLKVHFANAKFTDPFQKIKKTLICLLCGTMLYPKNFVSHVKGDIHMSKFVQYCSLNSSIPISSALVILEDLSFCCTICNTVLSKSVPYLLLKKKLKNIKLHWPCPKINEKVAEPTNKSEIINEKKKKLIEKNQNATQDTSITRLDPCLSFGSTCKKSGMKSHDLSCSQNAIDFKKIEKTMESIVKIFEKRIINIAFYKSAYLISSLDNSKLLSTKEEIKSLEIGQPTAYRKTSHECCRCKFFYCSWEGKSFFPNIQSQFLLPKSVKCLCPHRPPSKTEKKKEVEMRGEREKYKKAVKNKLEIQSLENNIETQKKREPTIEENTEESTSKEKQKNEYITEEEQKKKSTRKEERKNEFITKEKKNEGESTSKEGRKNKFSSKKEKEWESISKEERKNEYIIRKEKEGKSTSKEESDKAEENSEILLIEGLPKARRKVKEIYSRFSAFGKIRCIFFQARKAVVAFVEPGIAEMVANEANIVINDYKLSLRVSKKKNIAHGEKNLPSMSQNLIYLLEDPQRLMDFVIDLISQAMAVLNSPVEKEREKLVCETIISSVSTYFPDGRCYPFGSRLSGLTLNNSDLDVFFDCGGMFEGFKNTSSTSERKLVRKVAKLLRKKEEIKEIVVVDRARVPIVSFLHKPTFMRCDLSFKNGLSVQNTLLIKFILSLDWRVRPLILFLKYWTKVNGLHGPPYFSSYAIAMLVIYYLEQLECPVLPTIEYLQSSYVGPRTTIGGWDCSINKNTQSLPKSDNKDPLPLLLSGLFEFYAGFDYNANIISPLTGKPLPRKAFSHSGFSKLPMCYKRHILNIPTPIENLVGSDILFCLMDPFDLSHILTKSFTFQGLQMFLSFCESSWKLLKKRLPFQA